MYIIRIVCMGILVGPCARPSILLSVRNDVAALTIQGFQLSGCNLVGWCTIPWSISKMTMLGYFLRIPRNFHIFYDRLGAGRWLISGNARKSHYGLKFGGMMQCIMKRITVWNGHAQPMFAYSDLGRPPRKLLSLSERFVTRYHEEFLWWFNIGGFLLKTAIGTRPSDLTGRERLCQCILLCVSIHLVSQLTRVSKHLVIKLYSSSFSRFQVMALSHHHTKVKLIFKHHIAVPIKQFEQTRTAKQGQM